MKNPMQTPLYQRGRLWYNGIDKGETNMFHKYYGIPKDAKYGEGFMSRFPILFQHRKLSMQETCMCWGIECPKGWWHILDQLCTVLEFHNLEFKDKYGIAIVADQVKEKFGTLRFYYTIRDVDKDGVVVEMCAEDTRVADEENRRRIAIDYLEMLADKYIEEAEDLTYNTCARCGVPLEKDNKVETKGWITYICKECDGKPYNQDEDDEDDTPETQGEDDEEKKEDEE
jgi:hypothetical protein